MTASHPRIRYAVVGAGNIAQVAVLPAFEHAKKNSRLVAVISGDPAKRAALRDRYHLEEVGSYEDFESVLERGRIDAVYIATPNTLHKEFAIRAANAGAHVLCEKPLAPTAADCEAMKAACEEHDTKLMVAYRLHFEEATLMALQIVRSGELGEPRLFSSFFSHVVREGDIRRNPSLAGGATYDLGIYCVNAARNLFGTEPTEVFASAVEKDGTDDGVVVTMSFPGGRLAQFCVNNDAASVSSYRIAGTKGDLLVEPAYDYAGKLGHQLTVDGDSKRKTFKKRDQFAAELIYFSNCILGDAEPEPSAEEAICDVRVLEAILTSTKTKQPVHLEPHRRRRWPTLSQEIHEPAVSMPEPVHAPGPSVR